MCQSPESCVGNQNSVCGLSLAAVVGYGISLVTEGPHSLFSDGGTAIIVHAKADDYKTDPSGNSGAGIACGVISK